MADERTRFEPGPDGVFLARTHRTGWRADKHYTNFEIAPQRRLVRRRESRILLVEKMVRREGVEPPTTRFVV